MNTRFVLSAAGVSAAAIGGAATADITANITATSLLGGEYTTVSLGSVSGSITSIGYRYVWENNTGDSSWGSDMIFGASHARWIGSAQTPPRSWAHAGGP